jgi:ubiquinone/menaquinone biosynthesis C-methylase UbiE
MAREAYMIDVLYRLYWGIERVVTPGLQYSQHSYEDALRGLITTRTIWLDVGCGHQVLPEWRFKAESELVNLASYVAGIDMDSTSLAKHRTIRNIWVGDVQSLPFPDNSFTLITANMVVEHLVDPRRAFAEIRRVLAPGGSFLFHTPNLNGYIAMVNKYLPNGMKAVTAKILEGRNLEDVYPTWYRCNTEDVIIKTTNESGLHVKRIIHIPTCAAFARILPVAAIELLWIRATMLESLARYRTNILGLLIKQQ